MAFHVVHSILLVVALGTKQLVAQSIIDGLPQTFSTVSVPFSITPAPHPPIPTVNVLPLPPEFSDIPKSVVECWDAHANYSVSESFLRDQRASSGSMSTSDYPTPSVSRWAETYTYDDCPSSTYPGLTTLCDGYPRASACVPICTKKTSTSWHSITYSYNVSWLYPSWTTELDQLTSPTCTVATNLGPECSRLNDAFEWRMTRNAPNGSAVTTNYLEAPSCWMLITQTSPASTKPTCIMTVNSYEAYYWPKPRPSGLDFCSLNATQGTSTPTVTSTATISGLTFVSPSAYHLLRNITVNTYQGQASLVGRDWTTSVFALSTSLIDPEIPLTVAQREGEIMSRYKHCQKSGRFGPMYCTISYKPEFLINDLYTVQASHYHPGWSLSTGETICEDRYQPTIALPLSDIAKQNKMFEDCSWTSERILTRLVGPEAMAFSEFGKNAYHSITEGIKAVGGTSTVVAQAGATRVSHSAPTILV